MLYSETCFGGGRFKKNKLAGNLTEIKVYHRL